MDYKNLARKGRFGDNKIRNIDGKPAHVNSMEASLYDNLGKSVASPIIKNIGSGSTNPSTGLKEYQPSYDLGPYQGGGGYDPNQWGGGGSTNAPGTDVYGYGAGATGGSSPGTDFDIPDWLQNTMDFFMNWGQGSDDDYEARGMYGVSEYDQFISDYGTGDLKSYAKDEFGISSEKFDKFISDPTEQKFKFDTLLDQFNLEKGDLYSSFKATQDKQRAGYEGAISKSNMAYSGAAEYQREKGTESATSGFIGDMQGAKLGYGEDVYNLQEDVIADFYTQINQILAGEVD
jgi:hypothetical protein